MFWLAWLLSVVWVVVVGTFQREWLLPEPKNLCIFERAEWPWYVGSWQWTERPWPTPPALHRCSSWSRLPAPWCWHREQAGWSFASCWCGWSGSGHAPSHLADLGVRWWRTWNPEEETLEGEDGHRHGKSRKLVLRGWKEPELAEEWVKGKISVTA